MSAISQTVVEDPYNAAGAFDKGMPTSYLKPQIIL